MRRILLLAALIPAIILAGCGESGRPPGGSGLIEVDESVISAEASGRVIDHRFGEGRQVTADDTLVVIDPSRTELQLKAARAGLNVLQRQLSATRTSVKQAETALAFAADELARVEKLAASGTASDRQLDQAQFEHDKARLGLETAEAQVATLQAQIEQARADIDRLERLLVDHYPTATINGVIIEKFIDPGELLAPGKPIARIASLDSVWVKVYLPAGRFADVKLGDPAVVDTESGDRTYSGTVVWTADEAEFTPKNVQTEEARADLVYAVKVLIPNEDGKLKSGMPVYVTLEQ